MIGTVARFTLCRLLQAACSGALLFLAPAGACLATEHVIHMSDAPPYFDKINVEVSVGDTVTWVNNGPEMKHVVMDGDLNLFSDEIPIGKSWSHAFKQAGEYNYICHKHFFMRGRITVRNNDGSTTRIPEQAYHPAFKEYPIPTMQSVPRMIIASTRDDRMWFTEGGGDFYGFEDIPAQNKVASIGLEGGIVEYATPTPGSDGSKVGVDSLVMDRNGHVWFTERLTNRIGVLKDDGSIHEYQIPTKNGYALGVDIDRKGNIWFAERYGNRIGYIDPQGKIVEIELPDKESEPRTIFVDSKNRIWYTARVANEIGYYDTGSGRFVRLQIPTKEARPAGIAEAPDGSIYFVEMVGNKIAKVVGDQIVEYSLPTAFAASFKIVPDGRGSLWFTEVYANAIGRFDLKTGQITEFKIPTADSRPGGIAVDAKGRIWFTEQLGNKIGMFDPVQAEKLIAQAAAKTTTAAAHTHSDKASTTAGPGSVPAAAAAKPAQPAPAAPDRASETDKAAGKDASAASPGYELFKVPTAGSGPGNTLVRDEQDWLWFPEMFGNKIGAINLKTHDFREIALPRPVSMPVGISIEPGGRIWAAQFRGNALTLIESGPGTVREFPLPWKNAMPTSIALDSGEVWMTLMANNAIVRFDQKTESFTRFPLPEEDSRPLYILPDGKGGLWVSVAREGGGYIARFDVKAHTYDVFKTVEPGATPVGLLMDGPYLWVAEGGGGYLSRFETRTAQWTRFKIPGEKAAPVRLAKDNAGRIWITDGGEIGGVGGNKLAVFDIATRQFTTVPMESREAKPMGIYAAPNGDVWFTLQGINRISFIPAKVI
jgi:streptogramin lyase/plastocyanin